MKVRVIGMTIAAALVLFATGARAVVVSDGSDWSAGWTFGSFGSNGGTASAVVENSGGNPNARLNVTTVTGASGSAGGTALLSGVSVTTPLSGAGFTLQLDVLSGAGAFGQGQAIALLVEQGGSVYIQSLGITGFPLNAFTTQQYVGTFSPGSFSLLSGGGPANPTFNGVATMRVGFSASNSNSNTLTQYYDNFSVTFQAAPPPVAQQITIPTLSGYALVALAAVLVLGAALRLRRRS